MPLIGPVPPDFHGLFASWARLEPRCRSDDFRKGLEAPTADPLWMLGRQWQLAEFRAEDAGSPVDAIVTYRTAALGSLEVDKSVTAIAAPLEALVEREAVPWDWRSRIRVGKQFERLAWSKLGAGAANVIQVFRDACAVKPLSEDERASLDRATQRYRTFMVGRAIDGQALWERLQRGELPPQLANTGIAADKLDAVFADLRTWLGRLFSQPGEKAATAWRPERLDYEFAVRAPIGPDPGLRLSAPSYRNGELDWHTCILDGLPAATWGSAPPRHSLPSRVSFGGMPHRRWWAFEDNRTDFGEIEVAAPDLVKLALIEFALVYSDDWFVVPLAVSAGSVTQIVTLEVKDVFGLSRVVNRARNIGASPLDRWEVFAPSLRAGGDGGGAPLLFVPPAMGLREESSAVEEVRFLRDEDANLVWAVEHTIPNGLGRPVSGFDAQLERRAREREAAERAALAAGGNRATASPPPTVPAYKLSTVVPPNWIPFIPADAHAALGPRGPGRPSVRLVRAVMLSNETGDAGKLVPSLSRLLNLRSGEPVLWVDEEAVPREGVRVQLTRQRVRAPDGETYVWLGRKVLVGRGEGRSGLRFDVVQGVGA